MCACVLYVSRNLNAEQDILSKILTKAILLIDHDLDTIFLVGSFVCSLITSKREDEKRILKCSTVHT